jgi:hypothetical protein
MTPRLCSRVALGFRREDERMKIQEVPFCTVDWSAIEPTEDAGERGTAFWRTQHFGPQENSIRVRMVEYSPGYILHCSEPT